MTRTLALALALALPSAAPAAEWGLHLGLDYAREDRAQDGLPGATQHRLELNLGADAAGFLYSPTAAQWLAMVNWRRLTESNGAVDTTRQALTYQLRLAFFQDPRSPVGLQFYAVRTDEDIKVDGTSGTTRADTTIAGVDLRLVAPGRPYLNLGYQYLDRNESGPLLLGADRTVHGVSASTGHGAGTYSYSARYMGRFSTGTYAWDNFDDHRVDVDVQANVAPDVTARLSDVFYRRVPDTRSNVNLAQESNSVSTSVTALDGDAGQQQVTYSYTHALSTGLAGAGPGVDLERAEQRLTWGLFRAFTGTPWQLRTLADLSLSEIRSATAVDRATGELVSVQGVWRRGDAQDLLDVHAGPSFGARQPDSGEATFGYGGLLGGVAQHAWGQLLGSASYTITYENDLYGTSGWSLRQDALGALSSPLWVGRASLQLQASAARRDGGILGRSASRALSATADYQWRRYALQASGGITSGVTGSLGEPLRGDGLFIPAPFDTHSRYASLTFTGNLVDYLWFTTRARHTSLTMPDRPDLGESELFASLAWGYAGIFVGLEDRYLVSSGGGLTIRDNQLMVRLRRDFGSRR